MIVTVGVLALWKSSTRAPGVPRVLRFTKLTDDGQAKVGRMTTDGSRIYFTETLPDGRDVIAQVSVKGGDDTPLPVPFKQAQVLDLSKDGTELLIADYEGGYGQPRALWLQPVAGGSPRRQNGDYKPIALTAGPLDFQYPTLLRLRSNSDRVLTLLVQVL